MSEQLLLIVAIVFTLGTAALSLFLACWMMKVMLARIRSRLEYHDLERHPLDVMELPRATRAHFDKLTPDMVALGFRSIGDFRIRSNPLTLVRRFIGPDGQTIGEIVDARLLLLVHIRTFDFISVLADGAYCETGALQGPQLPAEVARRMHLLGVPGASVEGLHERHLEHLNPYTLAGANPPLQFEAHEVHDASNYGHLLVVWDHRRRAGLAGDPPTFARAEQVRLADVAG